MSYKYLTPNDKRNEVVRENRQCLLSFIITNIDYANWVARNSWSDMEAACLLTKVDSKNVEKKAEKIKYNFYCSEQDEFSIKVYGLYDIIDTWYTHMVPYGGHPFFFINEFLAKNLYVPKRLLNLIIERFKREYIEEFEKKFPFLAKKAKITNKYELNYFDDLTLDFSTTDTQKASIKQMWNKIQADCPQGNLTTGKITQKEGAFTIYYLIKIFGLMREDEILDPSYIRNIIQRP